MPYPISTHISVFVCLEREKEREDGQVARATNPPGLIPKLKSEELMNDDFVFVVVVVVVVEMMEYIADDVSGMAADDRGEDGRGESAEGAGGPAATGLGQASLLQLDGIGPSTSTPFSNPDETNNYAPINPLRILTISDPRSTCSRSAVLLNPFTTCQSIFISCAPPAGRLVKFDHPRTVSSTPAVARSDLHHYLYRNCSGDFRFQPAMPILVHSRASTFPFRRRRASSPYGRAASSMESLNNPTLPDEQATLTDMSSHIKPSSVSHSNLSQAYHQNQPDQSSSRILRPFRHPSTHFEKFQAKISSVRLRSSTLNPTSSRSASHTGSTTDLSPSTQSLNPSRKMPVEIRLPWESTHSEELSRRPLNNSQRPRPDSHSRIGPSPSLVSIDHNSDSSSHLTLTSEPSSNKLSKSSPWSSNSPPELELGFSFNSPSLLSGLPYCEDSLPSDSASPGLPNNPAVPFGISTIDGRSSASEPTTVATFSDSSNSQEMACSMPRSQQAIHLSEPIDRSPIVNPYVNGASSSLTSRVRPTPSPRNNFPIRLNGPTIESPPLPLSPTHHPSSPSTPMRALPMLNSYAVTSNQVRQPTDSSGSSLGDHGSAEYEVEAEDQAGSDDTDGVSDEGSPQVDRHPQEQPPMLTPKLSTQAADQFNSTQEPTAHTCRHEWINFDSNTPPVSQHKPTPPHQRSPQLSASSSNHTSYFHTPSDTKSSTAQSLGDRARLLLLATPSSSLAPPPRPARPMLASHRSHSASRLDNISVSQHPTESPSVTISPAPKPKSPSPCDPKPTTQLPPVIVADVDNQTLTNQALTAVRRQPTSQPAFLPPPSSFSYRHQSMYELRPAASLPSYEASLQSSGSTRHVVLPREEEGREKLPSYSCAIHLEGWMPRKMEFKSPGVQAKDRAWKRQYVIVHGTMIRVYRSDPHTHMLSGSEDPYSSNFVHGKSISPLASKCGITSKANPSAAPPLHFHQGQYDSAPVTSLKEAALVKATQLPTHHNCLHRVYSLQNAESGLAADYVKKKYIVRVRAEGEQFLLQAKDDRGVIDLIEALQAATNVSLDLDIRPLPKFITLPRRRRRRRIVPPSAATGTSGRPHRVAGRELGAAVVEGMVAEAEASHRRRLQQQRESAVWADDSGDRMADMLAEEQEAYMQGRS
ncbi:hypothetical protein PGTUg99_002247 [Puccinia graminis f. sp. tritici]|uniref:PH domain-containing protein n=2 Tax=Puccinia graminis f. sp. tritici TaxID=56615 RepID=A0A5B0RKP6_PUCGR|nr:hypothetical protein PGTUg99_002247 [Puccinia graminis f. sp. tritici]